jgi:hypothetical protein
MIFETVFLFTAWKFFLFMLFSLNSKEYNHRERRDRRENKIVVNGRSECVIANEVRQSHVIAASFRLIDFLLCCLSGSPMRTLL